MNDTIPLSERPLDYPRPMSKSIGGESMDNAGGQQVKVVVDNGKSVNALVTCASICGICLAATVGTVWHSKQRESDTEYRARILQNHVDEMTNEVKRLKDRLEDRDNASRR